MSIEIKSTEYADGKRICTVEYTYTLSDDLVRLGELYYSLGQLMTQKDRILSDQAENRTEATDPELERINKDILTHTEMIEKQQEYVNGYHQKAETA